MKKFWCRRLGTGEDVEWTRDPVDREERVRDMMDGASRYVSHKGDESPERLGEPKDPILSRHSGVDSLQSPNTLRYPLMDIFQRVPPIRWRKTFRIYQTEEMNGGLLIQSEDPDLDSCMGHGQCKTFLFSFVRKILSERHSSTTYSSESTSPVLHFGIFFRPHLKQDTRRRGLWVHVYRKHRRDDLSVKLKIFCEVTHLSVG